MRTKLKTFKTKFIKNRKNKYIVSGQTGHKLRYLVAHLAAKIILKDAATPISKAKMKAARQVGLKVKEDMPNDSEVEYFLSSERNIFGNTDFTKELKKMRLKTLTIMEDLGGLNIRLAGPLVEGSRIEVPEISLLHYCDNEKLMEYNLINNGIRYTVTEKQFFFGINTHRAITFILTDYTPRFAVSILPTNVMRSVVKLSAHGQSIPTISHNKLKLLVEDH